VSSLCFINLWNKRLVKTKIYFIVDDDIDDQRFLIEALVENDPFSRCFTASNGQEAITHLTDAVVPIPDVIFLDLNMPGLSGRQCLLILKQTPSFQHIPVIIRSTTSNPKEIEEISKLGASYFLIKRESFEELCKELAAIEIIAHHDLDIAGFGFPFIMVI
jgi:CheY-like chemotaxis protein